MEPLNEASLGRHASSIEVGHKSASRQEGPSEKAAGTPLLGEDVQRWTSRRRAALILSLLREEVSLEEIARRHGLATAEVEDWKQRFLAGGHVALRSKARDDESLKDEEIRKLKEKVGELVLDVDRLKEALRNARGPATDSSDE